MAGLVLALAVSSAMGLAPVCSQIDDEEPVCYEPPSGGGGGGGGGGAPPEIPFEEQEAPCDETDPECEGSGKAPISACRARDREIDGLARQAAEALRDECYPERGGDGNEHGIMIYRDRDGRLRTTPTYSDGNPQFVDPSRGIELAGGDLRNVVAIMHCHSDGEAYHSTGRASDTATLTDYGGYIARFTSDGREEDFRSYVVGRQDIDEKAYKEGECNEDIS